MKIKIYAIIFLLASYMLPAVAQEALHNLVVFVRFADEQTTGESAVFSTHDSAYYENLFNADEEGVNSVRHYFKVASYGKLDWSSIFFPNFDGNVIKTVTTKYERAYYQPKNSLNDVGYNDSDETEMMAREQALAKEIIEKVDQDISSDVNLDVNNDGYVDNLTFVFSGVSELSNKYLLWPKQVQYLYGSTINGKKVTSYLMVFDESNGFDLDNLSDTYVPLNTGVLCHEMSHKLGTYDLYHASGDLNPVGVWDLMANNQLIAQQMTAYTKWRYCHWLDSIPLISTPGTYTLNPIGGSDTTNIAYKIQPIGHNEYFVVEYRRQEGFDSSLPGSGLIVYRINPDLSGGNLNYNGTTRLDEIYVFRPNGTLTSDGDLDKAFFSAESGRTAFGGVASQKPFYSDGTTANFAIDSISSAGETISFRLLESKSEIVLSDSSVTVAALNGSSASLQVSSNIPWTSSCDADWLTMSTTEGDEGSTSLVISATENTSTSSTRTAKIMFYGKEDSTVTAILNVTQEAASQDNILLYEDWESGTNQNEWTVTNSDTRGWDWTTTLQSQTGYYRSYEGTHAAYCQYSWDETTCDYILETKTFSNGTKLEFYSRTNSGNQTPNNDQHYLVEISSDGGATWQTLFDCMENYPKDETTGNTLNGKYVLLTFDLSQYKSDNMKIRFHAYEKDGMGLSYYWQIDNVKIIGDESTNINQLHIDDNAGQNYYTIDGKNMGSDWNALPKGIYVIKNKKIIK